MQLHVAFLGIMTVPFTVENRKPLPFSIPFSLSAYWWTTMPRGWMGWGGGKEGCLQSANRTKGVRGPLGVGVHLQNVFVGKISGDSNRQTTHLNRTAYVSKSGFMNLLQMLSHRHVNSGGVPSGVDSPNPSRIGRMYVADSDLNRTLAQRILCPDSQLSRKPERLPALSYSTDQHLPGAVNHTDRKFRYDYGRSLCC